MEAGGFLRPHLPSPPPSSIGSPITDGSALPTTRSQPLKRGGSKESAVIAHVDEKLLQISRRYEKRVSPGNARGADTSANLRGYQSFGEAAQDLESVTNVVWVTGTPTLQTSYLLSIALAALTYLPSFPFHPRPTFRLLHKLDLAFASLLQGSNVQTGERLAGFEGLFGARGIDTTKRVRMRGLVERTRVAVVEIASNEDNATNHGSVQGLTTDEDTAMEDEVTENEDAEDMLGEGRGDWEMEIARVYERTIVLLGESLDQPAAGGSD